MKCILAFEKFELAQILRVENTYANAISKLTSSKDFELLTIVRIEHLLKPSAPKCEDKEMMWV